MKTSRCGVSGVDVPDNRSSLRSASTYVVEASDDNIATGDYLSSEGVIGLDVLFVIPFQQYHVLHIRKSLLQSFYHGNKGIIS